MEKLLSRDEFRTAVFERDGYKCVFCGAPAVDAHHILERRLWTEEAEFGGYFVSNGASVCSTHHIQCETTEISVEDVRRACGITKPVIPAHLYDDQIYDKWGNIILQNGKRLRGELFYDESVQKILAQGNVLDLFTKHIKYPRTYHAPWSEGLTNDDRVNQHMDEFVGKRVIVMEKRDGEQLSVYNDHTHARSLDSDNHPSRNWCKQFVSNFQADIPDGYRLCAENLYAKHSIHYTDLVSYFYPFSMWNDRNECLSWEDTVEWFNLLGIGHLTPNLWFDGLYDEKSIRDIWKTKDSNICEGYVIRIADQFPYGDFRKKVTKFVRRGHVATTVHHWKSQPIVKNLLKT